jgi:hypothetical protein
MHSRMLSGSLLFSAVTLAACSSAVPPKAEPLSRTYRMGFSATPPRLTIESVLQTIEAWRPRGDVAQITQEVPWRALLADTSARLLVNRELKELVALYRSRGMPVIIQLDMTDGLARDREASPLVALGRSISEPVVQARYREYLAAVDTILRPDYLGLAMETNLVRAVAPPALYAAVRSLAAAGAAGLAARQSTAKRFVSVQVETAWGRLPAMPQFVGIATDRADFPFIQAIGLSSYPYLGGFAEPEDVPLDYYARINESGGAKLPLLLVESGWSSASVTGVTSSPEKQARWIRRQMQLADRAELAALAQITYTDLDLATFPVPPGSILPLFAHLGLVDTELRAKPALAEWDSAFARPLRIP